VRALQQQRRKSQRQPEQHDTPRPLNRIGRKQRKRFPSSFACMPIVPVSPRSPRAQPVNPLHHRISPSCAWIEAIARSCVAPADAIVQPGARIPSSLCLSGRSGRGGAGGRRHKTGAFLPVTVFARTAAAPLPRFPDNPRRPPAPCTRGKCGCYSTCRPRDPCTSSRYGSPDCCWKNGVIAQQTVRLQVAQHAGHLRIGTA